MKINKNAEFIIDKPLTRDSLQAAQEVLFCSGIPTIARLKIIAFPNDQGFKVTARWDFDWEDGEKK